MDIKSGVQVIIEDLSNHPKCPHGPTVLFSRSVQTSEGHVRRKFYACAACRDRKDCSFFLWQDELNKCKVTENKQVHKNVKNKLPYVNHRKLFLEFNKSLQNPPANRAYCNDCNVLLLSKAQHSDHNSTSPVSDDFLQNPTRFLKPKDHSKKEAQYLFSENSVKVIIDILKTLNLRNILCIGTPRIHEHIRNEEFGAMNSLLLDFDDRFHNFFGPLEYCCYNVFNHYFFGGSTAEKVYEDFLQNDRGEGFCIVMDPPFGGRTELLTYTVQQIIARSQKLNKTENIAPIFWIFPYFMERNIVNSSLGLKMQDYKVGYDNHSLFKDAPKKLGSPVRIFTNVSASKIKLPESEGYKYCKLCKRWVSPENKHCRICKECTSKDGRTYTHCDLCNRCVKPTWEHCKYCQKCCLSEHKCDSKNHSNRIEVSLERSRRSDMKGSKKRKFSDDEESIKFEVKGNKKSNEKESKKRKLSDADGKMGKKKRFNKVSKAKKQKIIARKKIREKKSRKITVQ